MTQPPGPEELAKLRQGVQTELSAGLGREIDAGFAQIRDEIYKSTVERAERHSGYMRNWLALLTFTITVAFVIFGILGWTRFSDITAERKQMADDAAEVKTLAAGVQAQVKTVSDSVTSIQTYEKRVGALDDRITVVETRITQAETRATQAEQRTAAKADHASAVAQLTNYNFQSSIGSGQLGDFPFISSASFVEGPAQSSIQGSRFGNSEGRLYVDIQQSNLGVVSFQLPKRLEIKPKFKTWTDNEIVFVLSPEDFKAIKDARASSQSGSSITSNPTLSGFNTNTGVNLYEGAGSPTYLSLIVQASDGRISLPLSSPNVSWP
jgi:hypothetical protein